MLSQEINTWSVSSGVSNFIMHGDMHSINTESNKNYLNIGCYAGIKKMFNPILGLEFRAKFSNMAGSSQKLFDGYNIKYANNYDKKKLMFRGHSYGSELNLVVNLINSNKTTKSKYVVSSYFGIGYHLYTSKLYLLNNDSRRELLDFDTNSIYLSGQLSLKRELNKRFGIEIRTGLFLNYEDHLDATISDKQNWETFIVSSIGLTMQLSK
jgi:OOP family OmpA-OmpF porin